MIDLILLAKSVEFNRNVFRYYTFVYTVNRNCAHIPNVVLPAYIPIQQKYPVKT